MLTLGTGSAFICLGLLGQYILAVITMATLGWHLHPYAVHKVDGLLTETGSLQDAFIDCFLENRDRQNRARGLDDRRTRY